MDDKPVAVITGASSGIGAAIAERLGTSGYRVVLGARREDRLQEVVERIEATGKDGRARGVAAFRATEVSDRSSVEELFRFAIETYGQIDAWINNAGIMPLSYMKNTRVAEWDRMIDVNVKGVLYGIAAVLPYFRERRKGHILNIGSTAGRRLYQGTTVYSATKFAVHAITEGLRLELDPKDRIRVSLIAPGVVKTELPTSIADQEFIETSEFSVETLLEPEDVAEAVFYAMSQADRVNVDEILVLPRDQNR